MKAVQINEDSHTLYVGEAEKPQISSEELLVEVKATALNRADLLQKVGGYPVPEGASPILGLEVAGVVTEAGRAVSDFAVGDRVFGLIAGGGYAEYASIPAAMAMPMPDDLSFKEAAALPEVFLTAYMNLFWKGQFQKNDTVLIHAGASGVGTAAIQLVKAFGGTSIITAGSETKRQFCRDLGAAHTIDYKAGPFAPKVESLTEGQGVDIIFDFIGASYWEQNMASLAVNGRLVIIGMMGGSKVEEVDLNQLLRKRQQVIGTALRPQPAETKAVLTDAFCRDILPLLASKDVQPVIDSVWPVSQADAAQRYMEDNKNTGKIVLDVTDWG